MASVERASMRSPKEHLGFEVGQDRKLADWPQIVDYFRMLDRTSERVQTREVGKSTEGNPFLVATISSPGNLADLERCRAIQGRLADPRTFGDEGEADSLIAAGKAVVMVGCSIHATEVGASQMSMRLAHHLATSDDEEVVRVLENVICLLVPCLNPDGLVLVKRWYDGTLGTKFEGVAPPFLYHKYAGHDNNRDWYMFTQAETRLVVEHCLNAWHPQIVYDLHQTRSGGSRMILPPFVDPIEPNVDPVLQSELAMLGMAMSSRLTAQGKAGVAVNVVYDAFSPNRSYPHYHAGVRVLSEVASVRIATPIDLPRRELRSSRGDEPAVRSWNHPMPWTGGRWSLGDIVEYEFEAAMGCLNHVARHRDVWLRNFYEVGRRAVRGEGNPYAYLVAGGQRDPHTSAEMLRVMRAAAVEVHEATEPFVADRETHPAGTRVILRAQPYGAFAGAMLEPGRYPDIREYAGGPPQAPYDVTAHSLPIQMGVDTVQARTPFAAKLRRLVDFEPPRGAVVRRRAGPIAAHLLRPDTNASARGVNRLLAAGATVGWARKGFSQAGERYPPGTFVVDAGAGVADLVSSVAEAESLTFDAAVSGPRVSRFRLRTPRVGLHRSYVPGAEEGWTRFVFEEYGFAYTSLVDQDVRRGGLAEEFDAIVLPNQPPPALRDGHPGSDYPAEYAGGLGVKGAEALREFVERGGTLVAWDGGARYAIQDLRLPVENAMSGMSRSDFFAPGSLLRIVLDTDHPIAYGMPADAAVMFVNSLVLSIRDGQVIGRYPRKDPLLSGWLIGPEKLHGKAALATVPLGRGEVVVIGFRPNFRAQARGTYKILFNSLFYSVARRQV